MSWARLAATVALACLAAGCVADLDGFVSNPRHCTTIGPQSCEEESREHMKLCTPCDAPYPFEDHGIPAEAVTRVDVDLGDGETNDAYFIEARTGLSDTTLVYGHGNYGGIEHYLNRIGLLYDLDVNLFVLEYRGFGKSSQTTKPTEAQLYDDAERARAALDELHAPEGHRILYYGYSMGALPVVDLAVRRPPCALLLEAPWPSVQAFADDSSHVSLPESFLTTDAYDNVSKMPLVHVPVMVMHGVDDTFIVLDHGRAVYEAANAPKTFHAVEGAGHGNGPGGIPESIGAEAYLALVSSFMEPLDCGS
jgi:fermentation-respiration switch protein FrsA (DUF1100 family)